MPKREGIALQVVPCDLKTANEFVRRLHRHSRPVVGHKFAVAVAARLPIGDTRQGGAGYGMHMDCIVGVDPRDLPEYPLALGDAPRVLFNKRGLRAGMPGFRTECTREEREHTPPAMAEWLVSVARKAHNAELRGLSRPAGEGPAPTHCCAAGAEARK